ncbi:MAG: hypothetical protein ACK54P_07115, partial [Bacteroidota bacterium]
MKRYPQVMREYKELEALETRYQEYRRMLAD